MTLEEAAQIREQWLDTYQGIKEWQRKNADDARTTEGDMFAEIRIPGSRMRRLLPGDTNRVTVRCNTPIQGAGAAILKCALGKLWPVIEAAGELEVRIAACVHDEILLLVKEDKAQHWAAELKRIMESAEAKWLGEIPPLAEPSVGKRWSEIH
jgi:DNA polymerase I-like protein with 3'-5' exonuclease and polymerase domains